jgi:hypothetical protein
MPALISVTGVAEERDDQNSSDTTSYVDYLSGSDLANTPDGARLSPFPAPVVPAGEDNVLHEQRARSRLSRRAQTPKATT